MLCSGMRQVRFLGDGQARRSSSSTLIESSALTFAAGLRYYFWPHGSEPADIKAGKPTSEGWGLPQNYLSPENCPMWHFSQQHFVINSNLCGTFAAGTWNYGTSPLRLQKTSVAPSALGAGFQALC